MMKHDEIEIMLDLIAALDINPAVVTENPDKMADAVERIYANWSNATDNAWHLVN